MDNDMPPEFSEASTAGIQKMPTGIVDFDEITYGGLPRHRTSLVMGTPGSGKTLLALQVLVNGAKLWGEPGIFVAFDENSRQIVQNAATFGWDLPTLERERLFFLDARMSPEAIQSGDFDLLGMLASLSAKATEIGAKRIVFDSIDVLPALLDNDRAERRELYRIHDWLADSGLTSIFTARSEGGAPVVAHPYDFLQYMADCVVLLQHRVVGSIARRDMRIIKFRGSSFAENAFPLVISKDVAFKTTVTPVSKARIEGKATSQILYSDFGISIPSAPSVANVSDEVTLEINFVALETVE